MRARPPSRLFPQRSECTTAPVFVGAYARSRRTIAAISLATQRLMSIPPRHHTRLAFITLRVEIQALERIRYLFVATTKRSP